MDKRFIYKKGVLYLRGGKIDEKRKKQKSRIDIKKDPEIKLLEESKELTKIVFTNLPKISLNEWYAGEYWKVRKDIKDSYKLWIESLYERKFKKPCKVDYLFEFKKYPLDASNCVAMLKLIEDVLFPNDSAKIVKGIYISSNKGLENKVTIIIKSV